MDPDDARATPLRIQNSFLPWRQDGTINEDDMTSNLDLERMGALQQWKLRTMKQLEEQAAHCALLAPSKREAYTRSIGVNRFDLGCRFPGIDIHGAVNL